MKFKVGDKVRCIEGLHTVTKGCIYEVVDLYEQGAIYVIDDKGKKERYRNIRFELVQEDKLPHEELEKSQTPKYSYQTQILRSDGLLFTKDKIGNELVSDIQARMNRDRAVLRKRKDLFDKN